MKKVQQFNIVKFCEELVKEGAVTVEKIDKIASHYNYTELSLPFPEKWHGMFTISDLNTTYHIMIDREFVFAEWEMGSLILSMTF